MATSKKSNFDRRSYRPDVDDSRIGVNPLSRGVEIPVSSIVVEGRYEQDRDGLWLPASADLERDDKVSLYVGGGRRLLWMNLGNPALRLFVWVTFELDLNKGYVWVNVPRYLSESGVSLNTYKAGVEELERYGFILGVVGYKDVYWVNPSYCYRGSRVRGYPGSVVRR